MSTIPTDRAYVNSIADLRILAELARGMNTPEEQSTRPEYIHFPANFLASQPEDVLIEILNMTFDVALSGFRSTADFKTAKGLHYTARTFWELVARQGFIDHSSTAMHTWYKPRCLVAAPPKIDFCYTSNPDIRTWDTNAVYSHTLGTYPQHFHDYLACTDLFRDENIRHIVEPMAACAEMCFFGHFSHPDLTYSMLDLDQSAMNKTLALPWLPQTKHEYAYGDVLLQSSWDQLKLHRSEPENVGEQKGKSLCFIGKQSQNIFTPKQLAVFLDLCLANCDFVVMESMEYDSTLFTKPSWDAWGNTPAHLLNDSKIQVSLEISRTGINNRVSFESNLQVVLRDPDHRVEFIDYPTWHCYTPSEIVHMALAFLDVDRDGVRFQDDTFAGEFCLLDEYTFERNKRGSLRRENTGSTVGAVQTICLSRKDREHKQDVKGLITRAAQQFNAFQQSVGAPDDSVSQIDSNCRECGGAYRHADTCTALTQTNSPICCDIRNTVATATARHGKSDEQLMFEAAQAGDSAGSVVSLKPLSPADWSSLEARVMARVLPVNETDEDYKAFVDRIDQSTATGVINPEGSKK